MAVPTLISELSTTASSNAPAGSDAPSTLDDIQRAHGAFIAQLRDRDSAFALTLLDDETAAAARTTLGAAESGANSDITSLGAVTGVTAALADDSTKLATTAFVLANAPVVAAASDTVAGKVELATSAETQTGTDGTRAVTPAGFSASALGIGQTWTDVKASRALGTTYTNSTGRPIAVAVTITTSGGAPGVYILISGLKIQGSGYNAAGEGLGAFAIVPNGASYSVANSGGGSPTIFYWNELR